MRASKRPLSRLTPGIFPVLAITVLTACGGGSSGGGNNVPQYILPEANPPPIELTDEVHDRHTVSEVVPPGSYANRQRDRVRVMIQDDALDFTLPEFEGHIETRGASHVYLWANRAPKEGWNCRTDRRCQVFRVRSGGSWERLQALARTIIQTRGKPTDHGWFMHDPDRYGWAKLPVYQDLSEPPGHDYRPFHGTLMGLKVLEVAPDVALVPVLVPNERALRTTPELTEIRLEDLEPKIDELLVDNWAGVHPIELLDERLETYWLEFWASADIVNTAQGGAIGPDGMAQTLRENLLASARAARKWLPRRWAAMTQADVPESERVIRVRPTTNAREVLGLEARGYEMIEIVEFPELRGHTIGATTGTGFDFGQGYREIGTPCGNVPDDWNAAKHGRHYCLAAPESSTSDATAYISGTLANMLARTRGQVGSLEIVRRLMNTADRSGRYSNSTVYGAGLVDPEAALQAVGGTVTGASGGEAPVPRTRLYLPSAYGDAASRLSGIEIATFDTGNFPFWIGADQLIGPSTIALDPIPRFGEDDVSEPCPSLRLHATSFSCFSASEHVAGLVSIDGAGASLRLWDGVAVSALTQGTRRLDGTAKGAFSWGSGATLAAVHLERQSPIGGDWRAIARMTVAADLPGRFGRSRRSMFDAGPSLISSWAFGVAHDRARSRTILTLSQPPRAEVGTARLTHPAGRTRAGQWLYDTRTFSVVPSRRTLTARITHERVVGAGDLLVSLQRSENPGHTNAAPLYGAGIAWRLRF